MYIFQFSEPFSGGEAAEACLREAQEEGLKLHTGMYNAAMRSYLAEEETPETPEKVKKLFQDMESNEVPTDGMSLLSLAYAYAMQNEASWPKVWLSLPETCGC